MGFDDDGILIEAPEPIPFALPVEMPGEPELVPEVGVPEEEPVLAPV
jgi:hypothetical protein